MKRNIFLYIGIAILILLIGSYFIEIEKYSEDAIIKSSLLGVLIFHNPFILALYLLISIAFIVKAYIK